MTTDTRYVQWHLEPTGYRVVAYDGESQPIEEYSAGNHPKDSQAVARHTQPVPNATLEKWALQTAEETADSLGIPRDRISRDTDSETDAFHDAPKPRYYDCGICGHFHPWDFKGDCRDNDNRFTDEALDAKFGPNGYEILPMEDRVAADQPTKKISELVPGDLVDLERDPHADPKGDNQTFPFELATVGEIVKETPDCTVVYFDNFTCGFPPDHVVKIGGHDKGHDE